jgi:hypothetical protein
MKRRRLLQSIAAIPAAAALPLPAQSPETDKQELATVSAAEVVRAVPRFFTGDQLSALQRLADILMPAVNERPGAKQAGAAEFLDFLISESPVDRQQLYRAGLDRLNADSKRAYDRAFAALTDEQAAPILKPLTGSWTYDGPADPFARFLLAAKEDVLRATHNSRELVAAMSQASRGFSGTGYYWLPIE